MNRYTVTIKGRPWERITKSEARKRWTEKQRLYIAPCNIRPGGPWGMSAEINSSSAYAYYDTFDDVVDDFEYYNCINSETGKYASFYKPCGE